MAHDNEQTQDASLPRVNDAESALTPIERIRAAATRSSKLTSNSKLKPNPQAAEDKADLTAIDRIRSAAKVDSKRAAAKAALFERPPSLAWIAAHQTLAQLRQRIAAGADPRDPAEVDDSGCTALMVAANHGLLSMLTLLSPLSDWNARDKSGQTALCHAAFHSTTTAKVAVSLLLALSAKTSSKTSLWESDGARGGIAVANLLQHSTNHDFPDTALWLISQGLDPNFRHSPQDPPLLILAAERGLADIGKALLDAGADPLAICPERDNRTALMAAAHGAYAPFVAMLAPLGGALMTNTEGQTALMLGAAKGKSQVVAELLPYSERDALDRLGKKAIDYAFDAPGPSAFLALASDADAWMLNRKGHTLLASLAMQLCRFDDEEHEAALDLAFKMVRSAPMAKSLLAISKACGVFEAHGRTEIARALEELCESLAMRMEIGGATSAPVLAQRKPRHSL